MLGVALKGLAARKFRASLIALAIVLGVAMISGTYVLTDTINNGFNAIFQTQYKNADLITFTAAVRLAAGADTENEYSPSPRQPGGRCPSSWPCSRSNPTTSTAPALAFPSPCASPASRGWAGRSCPILPRPGAAPN